MTAELWKSVTQLTNKGCSEPPLMSVELWRSHDESLPVLVVVLQAVHLVSPEHASGIPELKERFPAVPVLTIQQPATLHSLAAGSVKERIFNTFTDIYKNPY